MSTESRFNEVALYIAKTIIMIYNNAVTKNKNVPVMVNVNKKVSITNDFERIQANSGNMFNTYITIGMNRG
jgi:hypothetical protein